VPEYENKPVPEGINYSQEHPLKEFTILLSGIGLTLFVIVLLLALFAEMLARQIPFSAELALQEQYSDIVLGTFDISDQNSDAQRYLQNLADELSAHQNLPEGMSITVHYSDGDTVNAFATLGGNIVIFKGLIDKLPSENALAMVLAHEIAHIKHRDPVVALGRGFTIAFAMAAVSGLTDGALFERVMGNVGSLTQLSFSREQETAADNLALQALFAYYGHVEGADALFRVLQESSAQDYVPDFMSTHPLNDDRVGNVHEFASKHHSDAQTLRPLPSIF